ncbi:MAG TPA: hypothetical protein VF043_30885 [Ktedonobacteraceae bacterium]
MTPFQAGMGLSSTLLFFHEAHYRKCQDYRRVMVFMLFFARGVHATREADGERKQASIRLPQMWWHPGRIVSLMVEGLFVVASCFQVGRRERETL